MTVPREEKCKQIQLAYSFKKWSQHADHSEEEGSGQGRIISSSTQAGI
jgi:hypothetical protein